MPSNKCYICKCYDPKRMSLFRVPNRNDEYSDRGKIWLNLLNAKDEDINQIRICSIHFLKKKPSKADDYLDVDWVPNQNLGDYSKNWKRVECYIRKKNALRHENTNKELCFACPIPCGSVQAIVGNGTEKAEASTYFDVAANVCAAAENSSLSIVRRESSVVPKITEADLNITNGETAGRLSLTSMIPMKKRKITVISEKIFLVKNIQTEFTMEDIDHLFQVYQDTVDERDELLLKLSTVVIDFNFFKDNDKKTRFFTGFTNWKLLSRFFNFVKDFLPTHANCKLSKFQMLVLTLMKLRLNLLFTDLGYRFVVDGTTASRTFHRCIYILFKKLKNSKMIHWPEERNSLIFNTPSYFRSMFKEAVTIIIDCFEIFAEKPSDMRSAAQLYSQYKHHPTIKILIGISMSGTIIFISKSFGGRTSDKQATIQSGFLDFLRDGDVVLADKGFLIQKDVNAKNAHLELPCFVRKGNQLHPTEVENSRKNSSLRIHVERVINILRQKFNICADIAKISALSKRSDLFDGDLYDMIVFVCSCIANICPSVVRSNFEI